MLSSEGENSILNAHLQEHLSQEQLCKIGRTMQTDMEYMDRAEKHFNNISTRTWTYKSVQKCRAPVEIMIQACNHCFKHMLIGLDCNWCVSVFFLHREQRFNPLRRI